ncbi:MAG: NupC/NupG family nucleoside CNT transporter [Planctomycetes bacterium]|nr:NupC/NupG family nucleoside CNT transporter [Planctomycetota bacterium]
MTILRACLGIAFFILVAWLLSSDRSRFQWRVVIGGIVLQFAVAALILLTDVGRAFFEHASGFITKLVSMVIPAATTVFGTLGDPASPNGFVFAFAGTGLVVIIFVSALFAVLYHLGIMQVLVWALAKVMSRTMGLSGGESMAAAANIFMGQTEAPLVIRPYVPRMTMSELNALMTGGFATIAGSVMAVYMGILGPEIAPHLITASVMSAPASFVIAKLIRPETQISETAGKVELRIDRNATNLIEAAANGTSDGLRLWLNVIAMLIAFIAFVYLINWPLGVIGEKNGVPDLSLAKIFGWVFAPVAWLIGITGWHDCQLVGGLLGTQISLNEFFAFKGLQEILPSSGQAVVLESTRSAKIAAYALCGFANFGSIGIQIGGISALAPERKTDLAKLALKAMIGGAMACWMTAAIAGVFL